MRNIVKWTLVFVLICLYLELAYADPKTEEVIKDIRSKISAITSYRADVVAKGEMTGETITYEGKLFYKKPNMSRVEMKRDKPIPMTYIVVSDGNFLYSYVPEEKVVQKMSLKEIGGFSYLISGLVAFDPSDFFENTIVKPQYVGEEELDGKKMYILENKVSDILIGLGMPSEEGKLWIGVEDGFLRKMVSSSDEGNKSFEFKNVELNPIFTEDTFRFTPPEGVHIQDSTEGIKKHD